MSLSTGCIRRVHDSASQEQLSDGVIVQVLEVKKIEPKPGQSGDRYRLVISDGVHYIQGMLATQLNELVAGGALQSGSIIRLNEYICNEISGKKVLIMLRVDLLQEKADPIGNPTNIQTAAQAGIPAPYGGVKTEGRAQPSGFMSKGVMGGAGGFGAQPGMMAPGGAAGAPTTFHPIASLHPYHTRWTIKARVTSKGDRRSWENAKGGGSLFSVDLLDAQGGQIRATMFKEAADKFWDVFQENQVYIISKGQLKPANKKFNRLPNEYELTLNSDAEVIPVGDDSGIEQQRFDFVAIEQLAKVEPGEFVDVIGVVTQVAPLASITTKTGAQLAKRAVTVLDKTLCGVEVTLWGEQANRWNEEELAGGAVLAIKACKVSDFGGRSLSSTFQSQILVNPDRAEAHQLRAWYDANRDSLTDVQNLSKQGRGAGGEGGAGGMGGANARKYLNDIKEENLGLKDKPDFFTCRATVTFFKHDWEKGSAPWYLACPSPGCNKKVTGDESTGFTCDKCARTYPTAAARYILSLLVCDASGSTWLTAFNDAAQALLGGVTADHMNELKTSGNKSAAEEIFKAHNFREWLFKIRCKAEMGQDQEQRVRAHILNVQPINYVQESNYLFDEIAKYD